MRKHLILCFFALSLFKSCHAQQSVVGNFTTTLSPAMAWNAITVGSTTICTPAQILASCALPWVQGKNSSYTLSVVNGVAPFTWKVSSGTLPTGVTLGSSTAATNTLAGTATGTGSFVITVTDSSLVSQTIELRPNSNTVASLVTCSHTACMSEK